MAPWRSIVSNQRIPVLDAEVSAATAYNSRTASNAHDSVARKGHKRHASGNILSLRVLLPAFTDQSSCASICCAAREARRNINTLLN